MQGLGYTRKVSTTKPQPSLCPVDTKEHWLRWVDSLLPETFKMRTFQRGKRGGGSMASLKIWSFRFSCSLRFSCSRKGVYISANRNQSLFLPTHTLDLCGLRPFCLDSPSHHNILLKQGAIYMFKISQLFVHGEGWNWFRSPFLSALC